MKLKSFYKANDTVKKAKWQPNKWERIFTNPTSHRGLISKIYKELKTLTAANEITHLKRHTELNREFPTEESLQAKNHLKKYSTSSLIREIQIKTTLRFHLTPSEWLR